jgi:hypothetical protein
MRWNAAMRAKTAWMHPKATWEENRSFRCGIGVVRTTSRGIPVGHSPCWQRGDFRCWPLTDLTRCPLFGRYEEQSGRIADIGFQSRLAQLRSRAREIAVMHTSPVR